MGWTLSVFQGKNSIKEPEEVVYVKKFTNKILGIIA